MSPQRADGVHDHADVAVGELLQHVGRALAATSGGRACARRRRAPARRRRPRAWPPAARPARARRSARARRAPASARRRRGRRGGPAAARARWSRPGATAPARRCRAARGSAWPSKETTNGVAARSPSLPSASSASSRGRRVGGRQLLDRGAGAAGRPGAPGARARSGPARTAPRAAPRGRRRRAAAAAAPCRACPAAAPRRARRAGAAPASGSARAAASMPSPSTRASSAFAIHCRASSCRAGMVSAGTGTAAAAGTAKASASATRTAREATASSGVLGAPRPAQLDQPAVVGGSARGTVGHQLVEVDAVRKLLSLRVPAVPGDLVMARRQAVEPGLVDAPAAGGEHPHQHVGGPGAAQREDEARAPLVVEGVREGQRVGEREAVLDAERALQRQSAGRAEPHDVRPARVGLVLPRQQVLPPGRVAAGQRPDERLDRAVHLEPQAVGVHTCPARARAG